MAKRQKKQERPTDYPKLENYTPTEFMLPTSHYDEAKADRAVKFIEMLPHTKGEWEGRPFWLLPWQEPGCRKSPAFAGLKYIDEVK